MESILKKIQALNGVQDVCVYRDGAAVASTLSGTQAAAVLGMVQMVDQIFSALEAIEKDHDELYFTFPDKLVVAYAVKDCCTVVLLTDKKINFPLIHMGVKSAANKMRVLLSAPKPSPAAPVSATPPSPANSPSPIAPPMVRQPVRVMPATPLDVETQGILEQLETLLTSYFGPASRFIFNDARDAWKQKHTPGRYTAAHLVSSLLVEFDSEAEKLDFQQRAKKVIDL